MRSPTPRQWTAIALSLIALPALTITAWPLVTFLAALLPETLPVARILWGLLFAFALVVAVVLACSNFRMGWLILFAWTMTIVAVAGIAIIIWLVLGSPGLEKVPHLSPKQLDAIATRAFAIVAGLGGVALLAISYCRQRTAENGEERETTKLFTERFTTASEQLGSEHAAVRLAGVHALAHLADDAPQERGDLAQMVIDVLCAYLRMPYAPAPEPLPEGNLDDDQVAKYRTRKLEFDSRQEVRHTIFRIIRDRLGSDSNPCWQGKNYDFTGAVVDGGSLSGATFSGGTVDFRNARFVHDDVHLRKVAFSGATVDFRWARFDSGGVIFRGATFSGGTVDFREAKFNGAKVSFLEAVFSGGTVDFREAKFNGAKVSFLEAVFSGGTVDFGEAEFNGGMVTFRKASGSCPLGLLEAVGHPSSKAKVILPEQWSSDSHEAGQEVGVGG